MSYEPRLTIKTAENSKLEMSPITMLHSNQSDVQPANSQLEPEVSSSFKTEELSAALRSAESRIKQNPSDPEALAKLGSCYLQFILTELDRNGNSKQPCQQTAMSVQFGGSSGSRPP